MNIFFRKLIKIPALSCSLCCFVPPVLRLVAPPCIKKHKVAPSKAAEVEKSRNHPNSAPPTSILGDSLRRRSDYPSAPHIEWNLTDLWSFSPPKTDFLVSSDTRKSERSAAPDIDCSPLTVYKASNLKTKRSVQPPATWVNKCITRVKQN